jgi:SpoVK/Ycf46/Vps4 family AAA+-type ATPase
MSQQPPILQPHPNYSQSFGPANISDLLMNNLIISKLGNIMQNDCPLTIKNILKLLVVLSASEIKTLITTMLNYLLEIIKMSPKYIYQFVINFIKLIKRKNNNKPKIFKEIIENHNQYLYILEINDEFLKSLYHYLISNNNCTFNRYVTKFHSKNSKEILLSAKFSNIKILINDNCFQILNNIIFSYNVNNNEVVSCQVNSIKLNINNNEYNFICQFTDEQNEILKYIYDNLNWPNTIPEIKKYLITIGGDLGNVFSEFTIAKLIADKHEELDEAYLLKYILIITSIINNNFAGGGTLTQILNSLIAENSLVFDINNFYEISENKGVSSYQSVVYSQIRSLLSKIKSIEEIRKIFSSFHDKLFKQPANNSSDIIAKNLSLDIKITNNKNNIIIQNDIQILTANLFNQIYKSSEYKSKTSNIKINFLNLETEITKKEIDNIEFKNWEEKKLLINNLDKKENLLELLTFINLPIPSQKIITESTIKKVTSKKLNEIYKSFDTLYLRKQDKNKLLNSLVQFKDKKEILKDMGIQNKLNILLYGEPGTGKTTTIQAIASYLQKDIYYVDLQKADLNEDLQMLFEFVNTNINNGGIVVIEDIDAMTDVVLKRTKDINELTVNDIIKSQDKKLTLEYFLNILQGTLTMDNSVFIVTTNHLDHLDPAFYRDGRFDVKVELKKCDLYQIGAIFERMMGRELDINILENIEENKYTPATIIYHIKNYIFDIDADDKDIMGEFLG